MLPEQKNYHCDGCQTLRPIYRCLLRPDFHVEGDCRLEDLPTGGASDTRLYREDHGGERAEAVHPEGETGTDTGQDGVLGSPSDGTGGADTGQDGVMHQNACHHKSLWMRVC